MSDRGATASTVAVRNLGFEPYAERRSSPERRHVGPGPGLVDEDQTLWRDLILVFGPLRPPPHPVGTIAFVSRHAFLRLKFSAWTKLQTVR